MQPNDDDFQLSGLLREWQAPETPPRLEQRVLGSRRHQSVWQFLLGGYIRVPVSVACALVVLLTLGMWRLSVRPPAPCVAERTAAPEIHAAGALPPDGCDRSVAGVC